MHFSSELDDLSVSIPTHNRADSLAHQLSLLATAQLSHCVNFFIFDNASTDNTRKVVDAYSKRLSLQYYRHNANIGGSANVAFCASFCTSVYHLILSDDDFIESDIFVKIEQAIRRAPTALAYYFCPSSITPRDKWSGDWYSFCDLHSLVSCHPLSKLALISSTVYNRSHIPTPSAFFSYIHTFIPHLAPFLILLDRSVAPYVVISEKIVSEPLVRSSSNTYSSLFIVPELVSFALSDIFSRRSRAAMKKYFLVAPLWNYSFSRTLLEAGLLIYFSSRSSYALSLARINCKHYLTRLWPVRTFILSPFIRIFFSVESLQIFALLLLQKFRPNSLLLTPYFFPSVRDPLASAPSQARSSVF